MSASLQLPLTLHSRDYYDHSSVTATLYVYMGNCDSATMFQEIRIPKYLSQEREREGGEREAISLLTLIQVRMNHVFLSTQHTCLSISVSPLAS